MKNLKSILIFAALVFMIGWVGHMDYQDELYQEAAATCETSTEYTTPTHEQCMANQFEVNNDR